MSKPWNVREEDGDRHTEIHITLELKSMEKPFETFFPLVQQGVQVSMPVGISLRQALLRLPGMSPHYLENRIQTIFLDGKTVDDLDVSTVRNGATVALSAALPGLVGAMLRKGGTLGSLRSSISHCPNETDSSEKQGRITLKLFNLLIKELGPPLLQCGISIEKQAMKDFIHSHKDLLRETVWAAFADGKESTLEEILPLIETSKAERCLLTVQSKHP